jgi:hypothetical protein
LRALGPGEELDLPCRGPSSGRLVSRRRLASGNATDRCIPGVSVSPRRGTTCDAAFDCGAVDAPAAWVLEREADYGDGS